MLKLQRDSVKWGCGWWTDKKKKELKKNDMKNNKLIIEIVGQFMPFKWKLMKINAV